VKTFTFRYHPNPRKESLSAIREVMRTGKPDIRSNEMMFSDFAGLFKLLTKNRLDLFAKIAENNPDSLTELAKLCDKDLGNIQRDVTVLESIGLIRLEKHPGQRRERVKPVPLYDRVLLEYAPKKLKAAG
jgi:predicted transcriptional regulator